MTAHRLFRPPRPAEERRMPLARLAAGYELRRLSRREASRLLIHGREKIAVNIRLFNAMRTNVSLSPRLYCCPKIRSVYLLCRKK